MRIVLAATLVAACQGDHVAPSPDAADTELHVAVTGGSGTGTYLAGETVDVWSDVDPHGEVHDAWIGDDAALLVGPHEWHTTFVMPAHDVALAATKHAVAASLTKTTFTGPSGAVRTVYANIPAGARGLVLMFHGTGGSAKFITTDEAGAVALVALDRGYGVLGTDAEEATSAGDQNGDGNIRWNLTPSATNHDLIDLDALIAKLQGDGTLAAAAPIYTLGMSNGGAMSIFVGAVSATPLSATFPHLRFAAVISHCADGPAQAAGVTTTPTAWRQCGHDDNPQVSNAAAQQNSAAIAARGVDTEYVENPPSPLYDARFARTGVTGADSAEIAAELRAAGFTDAHGLFTTSSTDIEAAIEATPERFPTFVAQTRALEQAMLDQLRAMEAEHQMYSDLAARDIGWFDAHP